MKEKISMTQAIRFLTDNKVEFVPHFYKYEDRGGTSVSSRELGVSEHSVIKTLIMEDESKEPLIVLMHGDESVSTKELARHMKVKTISACKPEIADKHSGYTVGGTSPFGTKRKMKTYIEKSIFDLDKIYINGGKRGFLVEIAPKVLKLLDHEIIEVGIK